METSTWYKIDQRYIKIHQDVPYSKLTCIVVRDDLINCHELFCDKKHHQHAMTISVCPLSVHALIAVTTHYQSVAHIRHVALTGFI